MSLIIEEFENKYWPKIKKKKYVHGYSGSLMPRIKNGQIVPDTKVVRIYVEKKVPLAELAKKDIIPSRLKLNCKECLEIETDVVELPRMKYLSLTDPKDHQKRHRPIPAGVSSTHYKSTACTLTYYWKKVAKTTSLGTPSYQIYVSSCEHCYGLEGKARKGDPLLQPSPYDDGTLKNDTIAKFSFGIRTKYNDYTCKFRNLLYKIFKILYYITHFKPYSAVNKVDQAFGIPINLEDVSISIFGETKRVVGKGLHELFREVFKSGRTTGITAGTIQDIRWNGYVDGSRGTAFYKDCVLVEGLAKGGDSGSPVYYKTDIGLEFLGALFAGSKSHYIYCKVENIEAESGLELVV